MRPRPQPRQLQLPPPGHVPPLRLAISPGRRSSPSRASAPPSGRPSPFPHCSRPSHLSALLSSALLASVPASFTPPSAPPVCLSAASPSRVPFSAPLPRPARCWPSPPPRCPVWPKDESQGETSKDKQGAVTSLSSLICHFSSSHKGQSRHGLNSGLRRRPRRPPAFSALSLSHSHSASLLPAFISLQGVRLRVFLFGFLVLAASAYRPPSFFI